MKKPKTLSADDIRDLRLSLNMTQAAFARELRMMQPVIGRWEAGMAEPNRQSMDALWRLYTRRHRIGIEAAARKQLERDGFAVIPADPEAGSVDLVAVKAGETRFICLGERPKRKPPFPVEVWKLDEDGNIVIEADKGR